MSELTPSAQMNHDQKKAMDVWLASASLDNNFETITDRALSEVLEKEHSIVASKSTIERWRNKFGWQSFLDLKVASSITTDEKTMDSISKAVGIEVVKTTVVDVKRNASLNSVAYAVMEHELKRIYEKAISGKSLSIDEIKYAKDVATLTSGREDRLVDRLALMGGGDKVSRDDFLNTIANTVIELEDDTLEAEFE